jgi:hypothetical protein
MYYRKPIQVFTLIIAVFAHCIILDDSLRYLGANPGASKSKLPDGVNVITHNSSIKSIKVMGVEQFKPADKPQTSVFINYDCLKLDSLIEVTFEKGAKDSSNEYAAAKIAIKYQDEDSDDEFVVSGESFFCNEFPAKVFTDQELKNPSMIDTYTSNWISSWFNTSTTTCKFRLRVRGRSRWVRIIAISDDNTDEISFGSFKITNNIPFDQRVKINLQDGDKFRIVARDATNVVSRSNGYYTLVKLEFEDNLGIKREVYSDMLNWKCDGQLPSVPYSTAPIPPLLKDGTKIWGPNPYGTTVCEWTYKAYSADTMRVNAYAQIDDILTEIRIGDYIYAPKIKNDQEKKLHQVLDILVDMKDGDVISVAGYDKNSSGGNGFSLQAKFVFKGIHGEEYTISTDKLNWMCDGRPACDGSNEDLHSPMLVDTEKIWKCAPNGSVRCYTIYKSPAIYKH